MEEIIEDVLHQPSLMSQVNNENSSSVFNNLEENIFSTVSNDTTVDFLPLKQSSFELNDAYCNIISSDDQRRPR